MEIFDDREKERLLGNQKPRERKRSHMRLHRPSQPLHKDMERDRIVIGRFFMFEVYLYEKEATRSHLDLFYHRGKSVSI